MINSYPKSPKPRVTLKCMQTPAQQPEPDIQQGTKAAMSSQACNIVALDCKITVVILLKSLKQVLHCKLVFGVRFLFTLKH